ncbi:MAG: outer membrane protein transport protein [Bacteroidales bacterium]|nr:outer membrane protein transport protein [Bacteroidales bacterium]
MRKRIVLSALVSATMFQTVLAGGYLTNTNQSIAFVREPSRDASIGIDGAYSNPAGLLFLGKGFQVQANIQSAFQHRYIESTFAPFALGVKNNGNATKRFEGKTTAPVIPSVHISWNINDNWNVNGSFMVVGGGGKCEYENGLGSFEAIFPGLATGLTSSLTAAGVPGIDPIKSYDLDCYMKGEQYYYSVQVGAGYKINDYLSVSLQGRFFIGSASYRGYLKNLKLNDTPAPTYLTGVATTVQNVAAYMEAMGQKEKAEQLKAAATQIGSYAGLASGVEIDCQQSGLGFTPIIGIDYRPNEKWNFAAKYEFKTRMRLKNSSNNSATASYLAPLAQFKDGESVPEDIPAFLTLGAMYSPISKVRINAGWHMFFDKNARKYNDTQKLLKGNTWEFNAGAEWDINDKWTVSGGWQTTNYGNTDEYMRDINFSTSSNTYGFGCAWNINQHFTLDLAYFFTVYNKYTKNTDDYNGTSMKGTDVFWRDSKSFGVGLTYKL